MCIRDRTRTGVGKVTVWYNGSTALPVCAGTYNVAVGIASSDNFSAVERVNIGSFTINKRTISLDTTALKIEAVSYTHLDVYKRQLQGRRRHYVSVIEN